MKWTITQLVAVGVLSALLFSRLKNTAAMRRVQAS